MMERASKTVSFIVATSVIGFVMACGASSSPEESAPAELAASASEAVSGTACSNGTPGQPFSGGMVGCPGAVTWTNRASLCSPGFHPASANEWSAWRGGSAPAHHYWTNDNLHYSGSGPANCAANEVSGVACPDGQPMRVCASGNTDPEGNYCNWTNCGLESNANQYFGGCVNNATAGTLCVPNGCADGTVEQTFPNGMVGCAGSVTYASRAALCAPGYRMASAQEWVARNGGTAPTHNYWTEDELHYNGTSTSCYVDLSGNACPAGQPMRVCTPGRTDAEGNLCNWGNCGINAASPNEYFGGCVNNTTAGALCVPSEGCADGSEEQIFDNGVVGCAGTVTWDNRDSLCAPGWTAVRADEWTKSHASTAPQHAYWTSDNLLYSGTGTNACSVSTSSGNACPTNQPMRVCPASGTDPEGNKCNWTNCGINANTPNQYFGGCYGNTTAGTLCAKGDLVTVVQNFRNITTETFASTSGDVLDACITPGTHRVMRFDFHSKNIGGGDITLGSPPSDPSAYSPIFVYSVSHGHWHIRNFNVYDLTNTTNSAMSEKGLKQAFCLEDYNEWNPNGEAGRYSCGFQGVSPGWEDIYVSSLPCQFINMDGMGDGTYLFTATTNQSHVVAESDYSNNKTTTYLKIAGDTVTVVAGP